MRLRSAPHLPCRCSKILRDHSETARAKLAAEDVGRFIRSSLLASPFDFPSAARAVADESRPRGKQRLAVQRAMVEIATARTPAKSMERCLMIRADQGVRSSPSRELGKKRASRSSEPRARGRRASAHTCRHESKRPSKKGKPPGGDPAAPVRRRSCRGAGSATAGARLLMW